MRAAPVSGLSVVLVYALHRRLAHTHRGERP